MTQVQHEPIPTHTPIGDLVVNKKWCKGCNLCVGVCPKQVLSLDVFGKVQISQAEKCTGCGMCETMCPDYVIRVIKRA